MKKIMAVVLPVLMVLAAATAILSHEAGEGKEAGWTGDKDGMMKMCPFCVKGVNAEVKNTEKGADIVITTTDKNDVKEIQERAEKMVKWHMEMMKGGKMEMEKGGMMMGGGMQGYGHMHIVFRIIFMLVVFILLVLLIILMIYKIRVLGKQLKQ